MIRLNLVDQHKQHRLIYTDGESNKLFVKPSNAVKVNLIGYWRKSLSNPLWIMTSLELERGINIYQQRMKIERTFND